MKIVFLGTNGWYDTKTGNTICVLIETEKGYIILDAGSGLYKIDRYIHQTKPIYLFLSHFHLDHIIGFHTLFKFHFPQGINIYGPQGILENISTIVRQPYTVAIKDLSTPIRINELGSNCETVINSIPFNVIYRELIHSTPCYGYRFLLEGKIIVYCTDTGICNELYSLAKGADLLIAECTLKSGEVDEKWPHLNPEDVAHVAKESRVKQLALVHFDANNYQSMDERRGAEDSAKKIFGNVFSAQDDSEVIL